MNVPAVSVKSDAAGTFIFSFKKPPFRGMPEIRGYKNSAKNIKKRKVYLKHNCFSGQGKPYKGDLSGLN